MKKYISDLLLISLLFFFSFFFLKSFGFVSAQTCPPTDYDCQIREIQREIDARLPAHEKNKEDLAGLRKQLSDISKKITNIQLQLKKFESDIKNREEELAYTKKIFEEKTVNQYKSLRLYDPILPFISSSNASTAFRELTFRQKAADEDRKVMKEYANDLSKLKSDKETLEKSKTSLASLQKQVSEKEKFLAGEVEKVEGYLSTLSLKQQSIIAAKTGSFYASVGDSDLADDYNASIRGFRESAPSGSFSVFSFGAYTHRMGMSQYGAKGRAISGKTYDEILRAYYKFDSYEDRNSIVIRVNNGDGVNKGVVIWSGSLEEYVKRIYEVPSSWPISSLQAQAIAARTYVLAVTNNGAGSICATQDCQVFKTEPKGGNWENAVNSTSGKVMIFGGQPIKAYFSSTTGGFLTTMGWDTTDGSGGGNFVDKAFEKIGGSPWVYKAWYTEGYSPSSNKCGRTNPWLNSTELADIINAALVLKNKGSDERISPITTSCWPGNPYNHEELKNAAIPYGGISTVSSVSVQQGNGTTLSVTINGSISLSGDEFKQAFILRAPGYLKIPQKGFAFFNIEKK